MTSAAAVGREPPPDLLLALVLALVGAAGAVVGVLVLNACSPPAATDGPTRARWVDPDLNAVCYAEDDGVACYRIRPLECP